MLIAESSPGNVALLALMFLALGLFSGVVAKYWFSFVEDHPPREGTLAHRQWASTKRYLPFYRFLVGTGAIGSLLAGFGMLVFAIHGALSA